MYVYNERGGSPAANSFGVNILIFKQYLYKYNLLSNSSIKVY